MVKILPKTANKNLPTYRKLPEQPLKLSVLKLDGSSFSFHVARNATVGRLKLAIEEEFSLSRKDDRNHLWSIVWSHFCLCYEDKKLISEKASIQKYGIKDGDQLYFMKHLRIEHATYPLESKYHNNVEYKDCSERSSEWMFPDTIQPLNGCIEIAFRGYDSVVFQISGTNAFDTRVSDQIEHEYADDLKCLHMEKNWLIFQCQNRS